MVPQVLAVGFGYARPGAATLSDTLQDLRHSFRSLRKNPGFTLSVVGTLALGIGAGTAIFTVVDAVLLRPLPFEDPEQLVRVWASDEEEGRPYLDMLYSDVEVIAEGVESLVSVTGFSLAPRTLLTAQLEDPEEVTVARATENIFGTFRINPALGRLFDATDAARGEQVIVISHALWQRRYGGGRYALGTMVHLNTRSYEIVGVLPYGLQYPDRADMWRPLLPDEREDDDRELQVFARLTESSSLQAATAELQGLAAGLAETNPETHGGVSAWIQPLQAMVVRDVRTALLTFLGAVGLVLLITCVNTANLLLARAADRRHELAVRTALGATRSRVLRSHLTESLVLAAFGGVLGLFAGRWALGAILAVMAIVTTVAGALFGVGPALHAASTSPGASLAEWRHGANPVGWPSSAPVRARDH